MFPIMLVRQMRSLDVDARFILEYNEPLLATRFSPGTLSMLLRYVVVEGRPCRLVLGDGCLVQKPFGHKNISQVHTPWDS